LFWIGDENEIWLQARLPATDASNFRPDQNVIILERQKGPDNAPIIAQGTIDFIDFQGPDKEDVTVYINAKRWDVDVFSTYEVIIPETSSSVYHSLPEQALHKDEKGVYVWKADRSAGTASEVRITRVDVQPQNVEAGVVFFDLAQNASLRAGALFISSAVDAPLNNGDIVQSYSDTDPKSWIEAYTQSYYGAPRGGCIGTTASTDQTAGTSGTAGCSSCQLAGGKETKNPNKGPEECLIPASLLEEQTEPEFMPEREEPELEQSLPHSLPLSAS
jgi:hypothetical protein